MRTIAWLVLAGLLMGSPWCCRSVEPARGAPAPFPHHGRPARLRPALLVGRWAVRWGDVSCVIRLGPLGRYECHWCGSRYLGWWGVRGGVLWIEEWLPSAWSETPPPVRLYRIALDPGTRSGPVIEGSTATVTLVRRLP